MFDIRCEASAMKAEEFGDTCKHRLPIMTPVSIAPITIAPVSGAMSCDVMYCSLVADPTKPVLYELCSTCDVMYHRSRWQTRRGGLRSSRT